jgi:predicted XRE-type DNA-binding protein
MSRNSQNILITESSGNVFVDLGIENPGLELAKAKMAHRIRFVIKERNLTQDEAANIIGVKRPRISEVINGKIAHCSFDRLYKYLEALDSSLSITVMETSDRHSEITVNT